MNVDNHQSFKMACCKCRPLTIYPSTTRVGKLQTTGWIRLTTMLNPAHHYAESGPRMPPEVFLFFLIQHIESSQFVNILSNSHVHCDIAAHQGK